MSQLIKHIEADPDTSYLFQVSLDHAPEPGELGEIERQIQDAMAALGVPPEQVSVFPVKSAVQEGMATPQEEEDVPQPGRRYLLFVLIRTEEGGFTEERHEVGERAAKAFAKFAGLSPGDVSAVVLEDAYLEVKIRKQPMASVSSYTERTMTPEWKKIQERRR